MKRDTVQIESYLFLVLNLWFYLYIISVLLQNNLVMYNIENINLIIKLNDR